MDLPALLVAIGTLIGVLTTSILALRAKSTAEDSNRHIKMVNHAVNGRGDGQPTIQDQIQTLTNRIGGTWHDPQHVALVSRVDAIQAWIEQHGGVLEMTTPGGTVTPGKDIGHGDLRAEASQDPQH